MPAIITAIRLSIFYTVMFGELFTNRTVNLLGIQFAPKPFQTGIIIRKLLIELFYSIFIYVPFS